MNISRRFWFYALFSLFALSGFSGLIYESVWSHYLKLFLGHAAYAQTLVLAIFMGGMAAGAWLAGRFIHRVKSPLMAYVKVELLIGVAGLLFHFVFLKTTEFMLDSVLPGIDSAIMNELLRWVVAGLLILPQSILLGSTFPLMSVGLIRAFPALPGQAISLLYFTNSIGAAVGVLVSGFVLIALVGLPGTIITASTLNFLLAAAVGIAASSLQATEPVQQKAVPIEKRRGLHPLLVVSLLTGLSSFIYEIGWIRMLVLVLGASTHAFELMLSAFILGLSLGGLWMRRRIDRYAAPERILGFVQILMGGFALLTVVLYNGSFDFMQFIMQALQRNEPGYFIFNFSSHFLALVIMLPTTFLAGMTLPLITYMLLRRGDGESVVGKVYAFNTLGAIIGIWLAVWILMPMFGLKVTIITGAIIDMGLGVFLLAKANVKVRLQQFLFASCCFAVVIVSSAVSFDPARLVSGVFRHGVSAHDSTEITFYRDGRTATVAVYENEEKRVISTNGKPDASVSILPSIISPDEPTMVLTGGLPLLFMPQAKTAAVIGIGSGISTHTLLASPYLERVDTIEIEPAMVEGSRFFDSHASRVFTDERSHIHIDDAKSYLASHRRSYDLIVSEPSNPWVSGVSSLFTDEFYARIGTHLNEDGLLVQWLHAYETNPLIVGSILKALDKNFSDYVIYGSNTADMIIVASKAGALPAISGDMFEVQAFRNEMERMGWHTLADVEAHYLVDRSMLFAWLQTNKAPVNSDYFPYLDQQAVAARFMGRQFSFFVDLADREIPLPGIYFAGMPEVSEEPRPIFLQSAANTAIAQSMARNLSGSTSVGHAALPETYETILSILLADQGCEREADRRVWVSMMVTVMSMILPRVDSESAGAVLDVLNRTACSQNDTLGEEWVTLFRAVAERNLTEQAGIAEGILSHMVAPELPELNYLLVTAMLSHIVSGGYEQAIALYARSPMPSAVMVLLHTHAQVGQAVLRSRRLR